MAFQAQKPKLARAMARRHLLFLPFLCRPKVNRVPNPGCMKMKQLDPLADIHPSCQCEKPCHDAGRFGETFKRFCRLHDQGSVTLLRHAG